MLESGLCGKTPVNLNSDESEAAFSDQNDDTMSASGEFFPFFLFFPPCGSLMLEIPLIKITQSPVPLGYIRFALVISAHS